MKKQERRYDLGKVDYNNSGRKNCKAAITWTFEGGKFAMSAEIWNPRQTDCYTCGQCVDTVAAYFPHNKKAARMVEVWLAWHLNDMVAGSPAQTAYLATLGEYKYGQDGYDSHYSWACAKLESVGLNPDPNHLHNGAPYRYGSAWLNREIPADIVAEIESW